MQSANRVSPSARALQDVLDYFEKIKPSGPGKWKASCPAHHDPNPSCGLKLVEASLGRQRLLVCCYARCTPAAILAALDLPSQDALTFQKTDIPSVPRQPSTPAVKPDTATLALVAAKVATAHRELFSKEGFALAAKAARAWLSDVRSIPAAISAQHLLGLDSHAVGFPYIRNGCPEAIKFRSYGQEKNFWCFKSAPRFLYNLGALKPRGVAIMVEGELDALSVASVGFTEVVSLPNGARTATPGVLAPLQSQGRIYIATDADIEGETAALAATTFLGATRCRRLKFRKYKDANEALVALGPVKFKRLLEEALR